MSVNSLPSQSEADAMEELVRMIWERSIKGRVSKELLQHSLDGYKANVVSNNEDGTLTVSRPFDENTPLTLRCSPSLADEAVAGDKVLVVALGNMSNAFILCKTDLTGLGGGGSEEPKRLSTCNINKLNRTVTYTIEDDSNTYWLTFVVSGNTVTYTWPDGHTCEVSIS